MSGYQRRIRLREMQAIRALAGVPGWDIGVGPAPSTRHCERSEAIHPRPPHDGLLRRFAPRNDGGEIHDSISNIVEDVSPRSRGELRPRLARYLVPPKKEGAGKTGCALHPRSRVQNCAKKTHTSIQVQRKHSGLPRAMVLRLISRSPWRPGFLATIAPRNSPQDLTPASGRRDHTTSPSASRAVRHQHIRVHRIPPRVRDVRTPLLSGETGVLIALICPTP